MTFGKVDGGGFSSQTTWQKTLGFKVMNHGRFATKKSAPPEKIGETCLTAIEGSTRVVSISREKTVRFGCAGNAFCGSVGGSGDFFGTGWMGCERI